MKTMVQRLWLAAVITLTALAGSGHTQQSDRDTAPAVPPEHAHANEAQMPASGEATTQETKAFTGKVLRENGEFILKDLVTKVSYKLDDASKAKPYLGKQVKVTGKIEMESNTIHMESIGPARQ